MSTVLRGSVDEGICSAEDSFEIVHSLPHGHDATVLGALRRLGLEELIDPDPSQSHRPRLGNARRPGDRSFLQAGLSARGLRKETASSSLGEVLSLMSTDSNDLYEAMDWLVPRQNEIEDAYAARHLEEDTLVLYDVSSAAFEGRTCPLGHWAIPKTVYTNGCNWYMGCSTAGERSTSRSRCSRARPAIRGQWPARCKS